MTQQSESGFKLVHLLDWIFDRFALFDWLAIYLLRRARRRRLLKYRAVSNIHPTAVLGDVYLDKNVTIGEGTYMNSGQVYAGRHSAVIIGRFCAIGYNVNIKARSHDPLKPTRREWQDTHNRIEQDIIIGDYVWIGDNVFIRHGVVIEDHVIVGANSVVTKDIPAYTVVGGVPARIIRHLPREDEAAKA